ncbi:MAG TPA: PilN domain-containing protein [Bryobacteraceae bacterium]|nr:PilN domain-containing protein [Bryobacteraceae bacterium]
MNSLRKWAAFGAGLGIEIGERNLDVTIARVRPNGIAVLGSATVLDFGGRPVTEWGNELTAFLRRVGAGHIAATVLLPRREVIVRQLVLPGVSDKDLASAIQFQIDGLHPFNEEEAVYAYARIGKTDSVLIGITRREVVERYITMFAEAGVKTSSFTFSAAAFYAALRILSPAPEPRAFVAVRSAVDALEIYGESEARPVFSAAFDQAHERAVTLAISELRLPTDTVPLAIEQVLPKPRVFPPNHDPSTPEFAAHVLPYATAIAGACPWLAASPNLLPPEHRRTSSRARLIPTAVLTATLTILVGALAAHSRYEDTRYLNVVQGEIRKLEPLAKRAAVLDRSVTDTRRRTQLLDDFRRRSQQDLDALNELTRLMEPPSWVNGLELTRTGVQLGGETDQAAKLLQKIDDSPLFRDTEFTMGIVRTAGGEAFRLRADRDFTTPPPAPAKPVQQAASPKPETAPAKPEAQR